jgi:hypothetical protein
MQDMQFMFKVFHRKQTKGGVSSRLAVLEDTGNGQSGFYRRSCAGQKQKR